MTFPREQVPLQDTITITEDQFIQYYESHIVPTDEEDQDTKNRNTMQHQIHKLPPAKWNEYKKHQHSFSSFGIVEGNSKRESLIKINESDPNIRIVKIEKLEENDGD